MAVQMDARPVSREVLEDRWEGLMERGLDPTKLRLQLDRVLQDVYVGLSRQGWNGELKQPSGRPGDGDVTDAVDALIRDEMIRRIDEAGLAR